jgi:hypothetical protein
MVLHESKIIRSELVPTEQTVPKVPDQPLRQHRLFPRLQCTRRFHYPDQSAQQGPETRGLENIVKCAVS